MAVAWSFVLYEKGGETWQFKTQAHLLVGAEADLQHGPWKPSF